MSSRLAWSTKQVAGPQRICTETLSQKRKKNVKERPNSLNRIKLPKCENIINKRPLWRIWSTQKYQEWWDAFLCKKRSLKKEVSYALVNVRPSNKIFGKSQESKYTNTFTSPHLPPFTPIKLSFLWKLRFEIGYTHTALNPLNISAEKMAHCWWGLCRSHKNMGTFKLVAPTPMRDENPVKWAHGLFSYFLA